MNAILPSDRIDPEPDFEPLPEGGAGGARVRRRRGFSLIEVLSAMTVLAMLVLMVARIFADSATMWKLGSRRVDQDVGARAVLELIGRQITMAMVHSTLTLRVQPGATDIYGDSSDMITFASIDQRAEIRPWGNNVQRRPYRDLQQVRYFLHAPAAHPPVGFLLGRYATQGEHLTAFRCHFDPGWTSVFDAYDIQHAQVMAEHVAKFNVRAYVADAAGAPTFQANYDSRIHPPPLWFDLSVFLMDEDDAIKAANLTGAARRDFLERNVRRYTHRGFPHNTIGLNMDP